MDKKKFKRSDTLPPKGSAKKKKKSVSSDVKSLVPAIEVLKGKKQQRCCSAVAFFFLMKTTDIIEGECSSQLRPKINIFKDKYLATYSVKI